MSAEKESQVVVVRIDGTTLGLPEQEVQSVESISDMHPRAVTDQLACGELRFGDRSCEVYALDAGLGVVLVPAPQRRVCVVVDSPAGPVAFLADGVQRLPAARVRPMRLPSCMRRGPGPFTGVAVTDETVLFTASGSTLGEWLAARIEPAPSAVPAA